MSDGADLIAEKEAKEKAAKIEADALLKAAPKAKK